LLATTARRGTLFRIARSFLMQMQERRREGRSPSYLAGQITTDRRLISIDCVVRNTSGAGARVAVPHATLLPDVFELHIPKKNCAYRVRACWRRTDDVGVEIVPLEATEAPIPLTLARRIKILEAENAALKRQLRGE
jgi:PilZ domain-containing protein